MIRQQIRGAMGSRGQQGGGMYPGNPVMQGAMARQAMPGQPGQMYAAGQGVNTGPGMAAQYGGYQQVMWPRHGNYCINCINFVFLI